MLFYWSSCVIIGADVAPQGRNVTTPLIICSGEASLDELIVLVSVCNEGSPDNINVYRSRRREASEMQSSFIRYLIVSNGIWYVGIWSIGNKRPLGRESTSGSLSFRLENTSTIVWLKDPIAAFKYVVDRIKSFNAKE